MNTVGMNTKKRKNERLESFSAAGLLCAICRGVSLAALTVLYLLSMNSWAATDLEVKYREISDTDHPNVIVKYFVKEYEQNLSLVKRGLVFKGSKDDLTKTLASYYAAMSEGKFDAAASLFYVGDGSKSRFELQYTSQPGKFVGYKKLQQVKLQAVYGWGPFHVAKVKLIGDDLELNWREALICQASECYLSNAIDDPDEEFTLFGHYIRLPESTVTQQELTKLFNNGAKEFWLPQNADRYTGFKQYPVAISSRMSKLIQNRIELGGTSGSQSKHDKTYASLVSMVEGVQQIGKTIQGKKPEEVDAQAIAGELDKLLKKSVSQENKQYEFYFSSQFKRDNTFKVEWYHPIAAIERMTRWTAINVIGYTELDNRIALYIQPEIQAAAKGDKALLEPVQLFILRQGSGDQWLPTLEGKQSQYAYLFEDQIMKSIQSEFGQGITFVYNNMDNPT